MPTSGTHITIVQRLPLSSRGASSIGTETVVKEHVR